MYRSDFVRCPLDGGELVIATSDPLIGMTIAEHYTIDSLIGEGAMGRVYRAHHSRLVNKRFALKILLGDLAVSSAMRIRFAKEAENASRLDHQNVVGVVDFGRTEAGLMYIVMQLVEGPTLGDLLHEGPMPTTRVKRLARQLCSGLTHAHAHGVVHRDFKPDNILIVDEGEREIACIADFGLAISLRDEDARLTSSGVMCTPAYAAPEQLIGADIDHRADLYALGVTLFEMLSGGVMPFGSDPRSVVSRKLVGPPPALRPIAPHASMEMVSVVERLLARDPVDRFQTADEVLAALDTTLAITAIVRTPIRSHTRRWLGGSAIAIAIVAAAALVVWSVWAPDDDRPSSAPAWAIAEPVTPTVAAEPTTIAPTALSVSSPPAPPPTEVSMVLETRRPATSRTRLPTKSSHRAAVPPRGSAQDPAPAAGESAAPLAPPDPEPPSVEPAPPPPPHAPVTEVPRTPANPPVGPMTRPPLVQLTLAAPRIVRLEVEGGLSQSVVRRAIERLLPEIATCSRSGEVGARLTIEERHVVVVSVDGAGGACTSSVLRRMRTEAAPDVGAADVRVRIGFGGGS